MRYGYVLQGLRPAYSQQRYSEWEPPCSHSYRPLPDGGKKPHRLHWRLLRFHRLVLPAPDRWSLSPDGMIQAGLFPILPRLLCFFWSQNYLIGMSGCRSFRFMIMPFVDLHSHGRGFLFHGHALRDYGHALRGRDYVLPPFHDRVLRDHDPDLLLQEPKRNKPKTPIKISFFMMILFVLTFLI